MQNEESDLHRTRQLLETLALCVLQERSIHDYRIAISQRKACQLCQPVISAGVHIRAVQVLRCTVVVAFALDVRP